MAHMNRPPPVVGDGGMMKARALDSIANLYPSSQRDGAATVVSLLSIALSNLTTWP